MFCSTLFSFLCVGNWWLAVYSRMRTMFHFVSIEMALNDRICVLDCNCVVVVVVVVWLSLLLSLLMQLMQKSKSVFQYSNGFMSY